MTITVGDKIPSVTLNHLAADGMTKSSTDDLFAGKKTVLFGIPGAFTPTCSAQHVPGFKKNLDALKAKGVDQIICLSVNDPFVMKTFGEDQSAPGIMMLPDGNGELTKAMGLEFDGSGFGLGTRCKRFAAVVDDGTVSALEIEASPGELDVSSAESILAKL